MLKGENGELLRGTEQHKVRWKQHFENQCNTGEEVRVDDEDEEVVPVSEHEPGPTETEVRNAIKKLKNNKAAGCDNINAEALKAGGGILVKWLHRVICKVWNSTVTR